MNEIKINIDKLKSKSIMFGTPMYGGMCYGEFMQSALETCRFLTKHEIKHDFFSIMGESLIPRARNFISDFFVRSDFDYLMFLDADIKFSVDDIITILHYAEENDDMKIICGAYPRKMINWEAINFASKSNIVENSNNLEDFTSEFFINPLENSDRINLNKPSKILYGGTGFMLIKKEVFLKIKENHEERIYKSDHDGVSGFKEESNMVAYFDCIIDKKSKRYLSEDYMFCQIAKDLGIDTWLIPWINLTHIGVYSYKGNMNNIAILQTIKNKNNAAPLA